MQLCVDQMSRNPAQGAHMLPSACAVLTCVLNACVISAQSMSNIQVPVSFLGHSIDTQMQHVQQIDSTCTVLTHLYPVLHLETFDNTQMQVNSTCMHTTNTCTCVIGENGLTCKC